MPLYFIQGTFSLMSFSHCQSRWERESCDQRKFNGSHFETHSLSMALVISAFIFSYICITAHVDSWQFQQVLSHKCAFLSVIFNLFFNPSPYVLLFDVFAVLCCWNSGWYQGFARWTFLKVLWIKRFIIIIIKKSVCQHGKFPTG